MSERKKYSVIHRWKQCDRRTKVRIAAEFFVLLREGEQRDDWWQYLRKKLPTLI